MVIMRDYDTALYLIPILDGFLAYCIRFTKSGTCLSAEPSH
jgi:hypothetical protein